MHISLRKYLSGNLKNQISSFVKFKKHRQAFDSIGKSYCKIIDFPGIAEQGEKIFIAMSYSSFLSAYALGMSGQTVPAYMAGRGSMEAAIYAFWVARHPEHLDTWMDRPRDEKTKQASRTTFSIGPIIRELKKVCPTAGDMFQDGYDKFIDLGAHPNPLALLFNFHETSDGTKKYKCLTNDEEDISLCLTLITFSGITNLAVLREVFLSSMEHSDIIEAIDEANSRWENCC